MNKIKSLAYRNHTYVWAVEINGRTEKFTTTVGEKGIYRIHKNGKKALLSNCRKTVLQGKSYSEDIRQILCFVEPCILSGDLEIDYC